MHDPNPPPELLTLMFGQGASAISSATPRLILWAQAFDDWLASIHAARGDKPRCQALRSWELLLRFHRCPPWDIDRTRLESWTASLAKSGHTANTIRAYQGRVSGFLRFCSKQPALLSTETIFGTPKKPRNPLIGASKPAVSNYRNAYLLRHSEARALLRAVDRQTSLVAKRDYALLLTLLLTGLPESRLRQLQWKGLEITPHAAHILPAPAHAAKQLPPPAWAAILDYLQSSGRFASIQPADYLFAPLVDPLLRPPTGHPADWQPDRPLSTEQMLVFLKQYADWAGLDASKVTYACLRHTAAALYLETGADALSLQKFLDRQYLKETRVYIGHLGRMLAARKPRPRRFTPSVDQPARGPYQRKKPYGQPGNQNALKHGFFSHRPPEITPQDAKEAAAASLESEIVALRVIMGRSLELADGNQNLKDAIRLVDVFGAAAMRISRLLRQQQQLDPSLQIGPLDPELEDLIHRLPPEDPPA